jgi:hypothetical protein
MSGWFDDEGEAASSATQHVRFGESVVVGMGGGEEASAGGGGGRVVTMAGATPFAKAPTGGMTDDGVDGWGFESEGGMSTPTESRAPAGVGLRPLPPPLDVVHRDSEAGPPRAGAEDENRVAAAGRTPHPRSVRFDVGRDAEMIDGAGQHVSFSGRVEEAGQGVGGAVGPETGAVEEEHRRWGAGQTPHPRSSHFPHFADSDAQRVSFSGRVEEAGEGAGGGAGPQWTPAEDEKRLAAAGQTPHPRSMAVAMGASSPHEAQVRFGASVEIGEGVGGSVGPATTPGAADAHRVAAAGRTPHPSGAGGAAFSFGAGAAAVEDGDGNGDAGGARVHFGADVAEDGGGRHVRGTPFARAPPVEDEGWGFEEEGGAAGGGEDALAPGAQGKSVRFLDPQTITPVRGSVEGGEPSRAGTAHVHFSGRATVVGEGAGGWVGPDSTPLEESKRTWSAGTTPHPRSVHFGGDDSRVHFGSSTLVGDGVGGSVGPDMSRDDDVRRLSSASMTPFAAARPAANSTGGGGGGEGWDFDEDADAETDISASAPAAADASSLAGRAPLAAPPRHTTPPGNDMSGWFSPPQPAAATVAPEANAWGFEDF